MRPAMLDRLRLTEQRVADIVAAVRQVIALPDPVGRVTKMETRPNGLQIGRKTVPLGVIAIIYEARPNVPGDAAAPYYVPKGTDGQPVKFLKAKPQTDLGKCTDCGACARLCPMGAINPSNVAEVPGTCIKCQRCVHKCTKHAKYFDDPAFLSHVAMLEQNFTEPKENEVYL